MTLMLSLQIIKASTAHTATSIEKLNKWSRHYILTIDDADQQGLAMTLKSIHPLH